MMRKFRIFKANRKGVSTIIAAALIVALTVILAVALGSTVLQVKVPQKNAQVDISGTASAGTITYYEYGTAATGYAIEVTSTTYSTTTPYIGSYSGNLVITDVGGDALDLQNIVIETTVTSGTNSGAVWTIPGSEITFTTSTPGTLQAGDSFTIPLNDAFQGTLTPVTPATTPPSYTVGYMGFEAPTVGDTFTLTIYQNSQPIATTAVTLSP